MVGPSDCGRPTSIDLALLGCGWVLAGPHVRTPLGRDGLRGRPVCCGSTRLVAVARTLDRDTDSIQSVSSPALRTRNDEIHGIGCRPMPLGEGTFTVMTTRQIAGPLL
jgi:hypothetical protein